MIRNKTSYHTKKRPQALFNFPYACGLFYEKQTSKLFLMDSLSSYQNSSIMTRIIYKIFKIFIFLSAFFYFNKESVVIIPSIAFLGIINVHTPIYPGATSYLSNTIVK